MEVHPDVEAATKAVASQFQPRIPDANQVPAGFRLMEVRTTFEPMLRKLFLILDYSDGISSMFLVQSAAPGGRAPVPALPGLDSSDPHGDPRIFRHVAGGHSQCWTARGGLHLLVVSRVTDGQIPDFLVALLK